MKSLPIHSILPQLLACLRDNPAAVLQAPPGAGKTTAVPPALLDQLWLKGQKILMLQPRRIAARHAAEYMAAQRGEKVGQSIGYRVRFERKVSKSTRIEVVTEGILTRRLQNDPELSGVGLVIFDEFHERSIHSDFALALCCEVQSALRDDLKLLVMSATLDADPVAQLLGGCPVLTSEGRSFPVATRYLPQSRDKHIADQVIAALGLVLAETSGDILAFLPGAGEIRRCAEQLKGHSHIDICPLFGGLPFTQQRRALEPGGRRRVVLATNIAETSLTIEGIEAVIDSGWERRPRFDAARGVTRLELRQISAASATQRRGRAARLGPGVCYRLWSEDQQARLPAQAPPEIMVADLASLVLELACWGETEPQRLSWIDPPPQKHIDNARELLLLLGAVNARGQATEEGRRLVSLPLEPRLAKLVLLARDDNAAAYGCELAALLSERDILPRSAPSVSSDNDLELRRHYLQQSSSLPGVQAVLRSARDLHRLVGANDRVEASVDPCRVQGWLARCWPDRIARQREPGSTRYLLANGRGAVLSARSGVGRPLFLIALDLLQKQDREAEITIAAVLERRLLMQLFSSRLEQYKRVAWDEQEQRVVASQEQRLGQLIVEQVSCKASADEQLAAIIDGVRSMGLERLHWSREAKQLLGRVRLCTQHFPDQNWPDFNWKVLNETLIEWLAPFVSNLNSRSKLERFDPLPALQAQLPWALQQRLEQLTPERIQTPAGSRIRIDYSGDGPPLLAVKLQELFGLSRSPTILGGAVTVQIHLLSPAGRPLAVTQDLNNFWDETYPEVRSEMRGRYPKHPWPEDPWTATATARTNKALKR